jgi:hypothetical protein
MVEIDWRGNNGGTSGLGGGATIGARWSPQNWSMWHKRTTVSGEKWGGRGGCPHLWFDRCGEAAAHSHDAGPFFLKLGDGVGDALVVLRPRHGVWQHQRLLAALLVQAAEHGMWQWLVSDGGGLVKKAAASLELQKGVTGGVCIVEKKYGVKHRDSMAKSIPMLLHE